MYNRFSSQFFMRSNLFSHILGLSHSFFLHTFIYNSLLHVQHFHDVKAWQNFRLARFVSLINESQFLCPFLSLSCSIAHLLCTGVKAYISMQSKLQQLRKWNQSIHSKFWSKIKKRNSIETFIIISKGYGSCEKEIMSLFSFLYSCFDAKRTRLNNILKKISMLKLFILLNIFEIKLE